MLLDAFLDLGGGLAREGEHQDAVQIKFRASVRAIILQYQADVFESQAVGLARAGAGGDDVVSAHVRDAFPGRGGAEAYLGS